eukprot:sb/3462061/
MGRQATGANTTPLGSLNPAFMGQQTRPQGGSLLLPHLAGMSNQGPPQNWPPPQLQQQQQKAQNNQMGGTSSSPPSMPGSWEPSRMRKKSKSRSRSRERSSKKKKRSRSRDRSRRSRRSRSRDRRKSRSRSRGKRPGGGGEMGMDIEKPKEEKKKKRRSRWGAQDDLEFIPGMPVTLPPNLTDEQQRLYLIHVKIEEVNKKLKIGDFSKEIQRSPSPEPVYNAEGKRLNTREFRIRKKLEDEKVSLLQEAMRLNPNFKPANGEVPQVRYQEKVMIPVMANPNVNFMGLLIGPRGNSLKKLEEETLTKIMIRGKGSVKEGKGRKDGQPMPGEDEELHALISAPTENDLHKAIKRITSIINDAIQSPDNTNELKKLQMRELALLNGTLRDEDLLKCRNCGALDHRDWECGAQRNVTQLLTCQRCGGGGHLASDCNVDQASLDRNNFIPGPLAPPGTFAPRQSNVLGSNIRGRYPGLGSEGSSNNNRNGGGGSDRGGGERRDNNSNTDRYNRNSGSSGGGGGNPTGSGRPPWQSGPPPPNLMTGRSGGGFNPNRNSGGGGGGGYPPRGLPPPPPPRAPWQAPPPGFGDWECGAQRNVTQLLTCQRCGGGGHLASDCNVDQASLDRNNFIPGPLAPPGTFAPRQSNVLGSNIRGRYPGLGSEGSSNNNRSGGGGSDRAGGERRDNNNNSNDRYNRNSGSSGGGGGNPTGSGRPPWQSGPPPPNLMTGRSGGGFNPNRNSGGGGGGGYPPRGLPPPPPPRAPWQAPPPGFGYGPPRGYPGFPPPPVNIPSTQPPPPPEDPPEHGGGGSWDQQPPPWAGIPPPMPPWMGGAMIPPVPPAPPSHPPPPSM